MSARVVRRPARAPLRVGGADDEVRLRALNPPRPVDVHSKPDGAPLLVRIGRNRIRVEAVRDTWRIDDEWWRNPIARRYMELVLEDGRILTVYEDLIEGRWYAQGA